MANFETMPFEEIIHIAILEMVQAGATQMQASTIKMYLQDHHRVWCKTATIESVLKAMVDEGALTPKRPEVQS